MSRLEAKGNNRVVKEKHRFGLASDPVFTPITYTPINPTPQSNKGRRQNTCMVYMSSSGGHFPR
jgi:hypothetical protein